MNNRKIIYLHGLDGSLSQEKKTVLERCFDIVAPQLDYRNTPDMFGQLDKLVRNEKPDAIIGNSMGGCFAWYLAMYHALPALCFNLALGYRSISIDLPGLKSNNNPVVFVIGGKDTVVQADENFAWIRQHANPNFVLKWYNEMEHRVDIDTFSYEVELFTKKNKLKLYRNGIHYG
jgi:pimeloyl-ACP methyl ester carboxylesterase